MVRRNGELDAGQLGRGASPRRRRSCASADHADGVGAIGGAALTNEGAFAWERFLRGVLGTENIDAQYGDGLDAALLQACPRATIDDAANAPHRRHADGRPA